MQLNQVSLPKSLQYKISSKQEGIIVEPSEVDEIIGDQREKTTFLLRRMDIEQLSWVEEGYRLTYMEEEIYEIFCLAQSQISEALKARGHEVITVADVDELGIRDEHCLMEAWGNMRPIVEDEDRLFKRSTHQACSQVALETDLPPHPNVADEKSYVLEKGDNKEFYHLVPNYSDHSTLDEHHDLSIEEGLKYVVDAMEGCDHLHQHGYVHGDVSVDNIFIVDGRGILFDLELMGRHGEDNIMVKRNETNAALSGKEHFLETIYYNFCSHETDNGMPLIYPRNEEEAQKKYKENDIFAFGICLLEQFTYEKYKSGVSYIMFDDRKLLRTDPKSLYDQILEGRGEVFSEDLTPEILLFIFKMLQPSQEKRPTMRESIDFFKKYLKSSTIEA